MNKKTTFEKVPKFAEFIYLGQIMVKTGEHIATDPKSPYIKHRQVYRFDAGIPVEIKE